MQNVKGHRGAVVSHQAYYPKVALDFWGTSTINTLIYWLKMLNVDRVLRSVYPSPVATPSSILLCVKDMAGNN